MPHTLTPIAVVHTPFPDKFGIPRQPGLVREVRATIELLPPFDREEALRGLDQFSHLWLLFLFHHTAGQGWRPTVRPPRLGGNQRVGVFASRSNFRPNPIGLSVVELEGIERRGGKLLIRVRGADLVDGTPLIDIKPYIPYVDALPEAAGGFAPEPPGERLTLAFSPEAEAACAVLEGEARPELRALIQRLIAADPRPAYREGEAAEFGMRLFDLDIRWRTEGNGATITTVSRHISGEEN